jgi:tRNA G10  N-methylase Trm11
MVELKHANIKKELEAYQLSYSKDGEPIAVNFRSLVPELKKSERYSHLIHSYPAKLLVNIPYYFLASDALCPRNGIVLDPFCGTGTVLLEAVLSGRIALGADANPLAKLITTVKTIHIPRETLSNTLTTTLIRAKRYRKVFSHPEAVVVWYSNKSLRQLTNIQRSITKIEDKQQRAFFELCFSNVIRKVSYADPSISVPVHWNPERFKGHPEKMNEIRKKLQQLETVDVYDKFEIVCKSNIDRIDTLKNHICDGITARIISDDARKLGLESNSVDLILTSPPYAGAQKYIRASWLNLYWLNHVKLEDIHDLKTHNIGREDYKKDEIYESYTGIEAADIVLQDLYKSGNTKRAFLAANYLNEMKVALDESCRVLRQGGYMVIVIGNNTVCKRQFDTQNYLTNYIVSKGMKLQYKLIDDIKSYGLMTKRNKTADKITREWVIVFKKV